jgi:hypothetical protein
MSRLDDDREVFRRQFGDQWLRWWRAALLAEAEMGSRDAAATRCLEVQEKLHDGVKLDGLEARIGYELTERDSPRRLIAKLEDEEVRAGDVLRLPAPAADTSGLGGSWVVAQSGFVPAERWTVSGDVMREDGTVVEGHIFDGGTYMAVVEETDERLAGMVAARHLWAVGKPPAFVLDLIEPALDLDWDADEYVSDDAGWVDPYNEDEDEDEDDYEDEPDVEEGAQVTEGATGRDAERASTRPAAVADHPGDGGDGLFLEVAPEDEWLGGAPHVQVEGYPTYARFRFPSGIADDWLRKYMPSGRWIREELVVADRATFHAVVDKLYDIGCYLEQMAPGTFDADDDSEGVDRIENVTDGMTLAEYLAQDRDPGQEDEPEPNRRPSLDVTVRAVRGVGIVLEGMTLAGCEWLERELADLPRHGEHGRVVEKDEWDIANSARYDGRLLVGPDPRGYLTDT